MAMWNPWRGCKKCSDGCLHCYIHKGDFKRNINTNEIIKTKDFEKPIEKLKNGNYKMKSGLVYLCFSTDFLIEEADEWRNECWKMIKQRPDCTFLFLTKRIDRFMKCIPVDWNSGYDNVVVCCTIENQKNADYRLSIFKDLPIKHKCITAQPLLERIDIELVAVGGESDSNARVFHYDWALDIKEQCIRRNVNFEFRQCGTYTIKDGKQYTIQTKDLCKQARLANIDYKRNGNLRRQHMSEINDKQIVQNQYKNAANLNTRKSIHDKYSVNKQGFGNWIASYYQITEGMRILELGCGTGDMWKNNISLLNKCSLMLTDISEGMLETARNTLGNLHNVSYQVVDIQEIPFESNSFDMVIANMMLFHVPNLKKGLSEVKRVLKKGGSFYCATYGEYGIVQYIAELLKPYGVEEKTNKNFTLQNGKQILTPYFSFIEMQEYIDSLEVTNLDDMIDYLYSLPNMTSISNISRDVIKKVLEQNRVDGVLKVPKEYGMFICK